MGSAEMRRGQICWLDLDPIRGSEAGKRRPAVIVSNDGLNRASQRLGRGVITVVPLTSNVDRVHPFQVLVAAGEGGLPAASKAQAEQVRSIDVQRVVGVEGAVSSSTMAAIESALRLHLSL